MKKDIWQQYRKYERRLADFAVELSHELTDEYFDTEKVGHASIFVEPGVYAWTISIIDVEFERFDRKFVVSSVDTLEAIEQMVISRVRALSKVFAHHNDVVEEEWL